MSDIALLRPGELLQSCYRVGRVIGRGGMGAVYEVTDERLRKRMALKQILRTEPALRQAFEREASLLANLRHAALPQVAYSFSEADSDFIVMDYIEGDDLLAQINREGALPVERVLRYADQLLDVLSYLHTRQPQIIHRDIKPENVKITGDDRLILLDFGIAKGSAGIPRTTGSDQSVAAFSLAYAPIEQILSGQTTAQSDLFSTGATIYHMLTGQRPIPAGARQQALNDGQADPLLPAYRMNGRTPQTLGNLVYQMMALRSPDRPDSALALRAAFQTISAVGHTPAPPEPTAFDGQPAPAIPRPAKAPEPIRSAQGATSRPAARPATRSGQPTVQKRIETLVRQVLDSYPGAWMVWCDPRGDWRPLLERVAHDERMGGFPLLIADQQIGGEIGGLELRRDLQQRLVAEESFVLLVEAAPDQLGWLWGHALLAERRYTLTLREQLLQWGWRPQRSQVADDEIALLARQGLQHDPAAWGGGGLQPDLALLLEVLAGGAEPDDDDLHVLNLTIEQTGLPALESTLSRWRVQALARLLMTQAYEIAPRLIPETHELMIAEGQRSLALELLTRWVDSKRLSKGLPDAIREADKMATFPQLLAEAAVKHGPFLSRAAEQTVFIATCARLTKKLGKELLQTLAGMEEELERHAGGLWGMPSDRLAPALIIPWSELGRLSRTARQLLEVEPRQTWVTPADAVKWYTTGGWQLDAAGEEIMRNLAFAAPELLALVTPLREAFRARWEALLIQWSDLWRAAGCPVPEQTTAGTWLSKQLANPRPTAILMVDALRYDIGKRLEARINTQEGESRATLEPARAPLPSITALGMAMALPIAEDQVRIELVDGAWRAIDTVTGMNLSQAETRRAWLQARKIVAAEGFVAVSDALRGQIPAPGRGRQRIVLADTMLDRLGHDDELELLGADVAIERYADLVGKLRDAGWRRIAIVTDHGYIHWFGGTEKRQAIPIPEPAYRSRRALAYATQVPLSEPYAAVPGGEWRLLPARGAASWSAYGGLGYFHGGASLQEWIIPCLWVEWPDTAQPVSVSIEPIEHILSIQPRLMLRIVRESLFSSDALTRHVEVLIRDAKTRKVLFRSAQVELLPSQDQVSVSLRPTPGAVAEWEARLQIEVRDILTEEVLAETSSTLRARLDEW